MKAKKYTFASLIPLGYSITYSIFSNLLFIPAFFMEVNSDWDLILFMIAIINISEVIPLVLIAGNIVAIVFQAKALKRKEILWLNILLLALSIILIILAIALFVFMILLSRGVFM
ncbi:MAG: hypothetical protein IJC80_05460 [Clostridia bacterium]|nr:hypothetical protein [Clostridia bacterium]